MKKTYIMDESIFNRLVNKILIESKDDENFEKGKSGMIASRSRSSYTATPKEDEIIGKLFGKYRDDIPPIVYRYLRKIPRKTLTKRLIDLKLLDKETIKTHYTNEK